MSRRFGPPDPAHVARVRRNSETLIAAVLHATRGMPETDILLELGQACPYVSRADREIWIAEVHRQRDADQLVAFLLREAETPEEWPEPEPEAPEE